MNFTLPSLNLQRSAQKLFIGQRLQAVKNDSIFYMSIKQALRDNEPLDDILQMVVDQANDYRPAVDSVLGAELVADILEFVNQSK